MTAGEAKGRKQAENRGADSRVSVSASTEGGRASTGPRGPKHRGGLREVRQQRSRRSEASLGRNSAWGACRPPRRRRARPSESRETEVTPAPVLHLTKHSSKVVTKSPSYQTI